MPTRDHAPVGAPCWIELFTSDVEATTAFYRELFGWTFDPPQEAFGGYFNGHRGDQLVTGGMVNDGADGAPDGWSIYLTVTDVTEASERCEANGGTVLVPAMEVMDLGSMAIFADPSGAVIGAWQPGSHTGFTLYGEPGSAAWFELHTRHHARDVAFYEQVFGSTTVVASDTDDLRYTMVVEGDEELAGIMDASPFPEDAPLGWSIYFGTDDAEASMAKVQALGGQVTIGPDHTPFGILAGAVDPTGIAFKLQEPPAG